MKQRVGITVFALVLIFAVSAYAAEPRELVAGEDYVDGEVLVKLSKTAHQALSTKAQVKQLIESITPGVESVKPVFSVRPGDEIALRHGLDSWYRIVYGPGADVPSMTEVLDRGASIRCAEPNFIYKLTWDPNDQYYATDSLQWYLNNDGQNFLWDPYPPTYGTPDADIDAPEGWDITQGDSSVVIAILDTGVDYTHEDLSNKMLADCTAGCPEGTGYDFVNEDNDPMDDDATVNRGHGTKCAGIAAAETNNGMGIASVCPECRIMPLKVCTSGGGCPSSAVAPALYYAIDNGADVASMSFAGTSASFLLQDVLDAAEESNTILIAAAGNDNSSTEQYPATYPEVIGVGGTDANDCRWDYGAGNGSNYGDWVDVGAPAIWIFGTEIVAISPYGYRSGTSFAAPQVAGEAALLRSLNPTIPKSVVDSLIIANVDSVITDPDKPIGGRINIHRALLGAVELAGIDLKKAITGFDINAYPNPSAGRFSISFELARSSLCRASVYDVQGRVVRTLRDGPAYEGRNELLWNGNDHSGSPAAPGIYFCRIEAGGTTQTRKMILAR